MTERTGGSRVALVIGVDRYDDPQIPGLNYPDDDARGMAAALIESGSFTRDDVIQMLPDSPNAELRPTRGNILNQLSQLKARKGLDLVVVYFSGHGSAELVGATRENFVFPIDTRRSVLNETGLKVADLVALTQTVPAKNHVIVLDACRSDPNAKGTEATGFQAQRYRLATGTAVVYGAKFGEPAYDDEDLKHGAFTAFLIEGLRGQADGWASVAPADTVISLREAYQYAADRLLEIPRPGGPQTPYLGGEGYGDPALVAVPMLGPAVTCPADRVALAHAQELALRVCASPQAFPRAARAARRTMQCLTQPLTPELAVRGHQIDALYALSLLDQEAAARAWRASTLTAQAARQRFDVPPACAPDDTFRRKAEALDVDERVPLPAAPPHGELSFDGLPGGVLHTGVDVYAAVVWDRYTADPPALLMLTADGPSTELPLYSDRIEPDGIRRRRVERSNHLLIASGGTALAAGMMMGEAAILYRQWVNDWEEQTGEANDVGWNPGGGPDDFYTQMTTRRQTFNALWISGEMTAGVAVGLGVAGVVVRF